MNGDKIGGQTMSFGLKEECVGIPEENPNVAPNVLESAYKVEKLIMDGKIVPPKNIEEYNNFVKNLY